MKSVTIKDKRGVILIKIYRKDSYVYVQKRGDICPIETTIIYNDRSRITIKE